MYKNIKNGGKTLEEVIDLREYFSIIKKKWYIIAVLCVICVAASSVYSFFIAKPVYQAETTLIVKTEKAEGSQTVSGDQVSVSQKLAVTYGKVIKSRTVLENVIKNLNLEETYDELSEKISVSTVSDTQIIKISVKDTKNSNAAKIANEIPKVFTKEAIRIADANGVEVIDKGENYTAEDYPQVAAHHAVYVLRNLQQPENRIEPDKNDYIQYQCHDTY